MRIRLSAALGALVLLVPFRHPTPTVVLAKQGDVIRTSLPAARQFFVRKVTIGKDDLARIRKEVEFTPDDPDCQFFLGKAADGAAAGVVLFPQVNTSHGPLEVGLALKPDGTIASVTVTKATAETRPWVERALSTGLAKRFQGLRYGDDVGAVLKTTSADQIGEMPFYEAQVISTAVHHGLVLHHVLFHDG
jgi:hypothetical protein